jgi:hypothetical protein
MFLFAGLFFTACDVEFHPSDRVDFDGDGFFAAGPGAVDGKFVCRLIYVEGEGYVLVQAGDPTQLIEGDPQDVCLSRGDLENLNIDCHDDDDDRFPNAAEICDGVDNDCDNQLDATERDDDGDGYTECGFDPVARVVTIERDCNDDVAEVGDGYKAGQFQNPGLEEVCGMIPNLYPLGVEHLGRPQIGLDDDCDGVTYNSNDPANPGVEQDLDLDGHADCELQVLVAPDDDPSTRATIPRDCDDTNPSVNPSIGVVGTAAEGVLISCVSDSDFDSACVPVAQSENITKIQWARDSDNDGDGEEPSSVMNEGVPDNYVALCADELSPSGRWLDLSDPLSSNTDCDDTDPRREGLDIDGDTYSTCDGDLYPGFVSADEESAAYPFAPSLCDHIDNDLDGQVDNAFDSDGDGAFNASFCIGEYPPEDLDCDDGDASQNQLDVDGDGTTSCDGDCNDNDAVLNLTDVDGDGTTSCAGDCDDNDAAENLADADGDGFSTCADDCDDANPTIYPGAPMVCNGPSNDDDNCDGVVDPNEADVDFDTFTPCAGDCDDSDDAIGPFDIDGDGMSSCDGDCDDNEAAIYLGAPPLCDLIPDNDCNGQVDLNEADLDGDTFTICDDDCDDSDEALTPDDGDGDGASSCAGDCDDLNALLNLVDVDGDGWPTCPSGSVPGDCDDADATYNPGDYDGDGNSTCGPDGQAGTLDDDCDDFDPYYNSNDSDGDLQTSCGDDCDDTDPLIFLGGSEGGSPDGYDNDCDGTADEGLILGDGALSVIEIMIDTAAPATDGAGEYIEVLNTATHPVDLRGWKVHVKDENDSLTTFQFALDVGELNAMRIAPGERVVLARSANSSAYGYDIADFYWEAAAFSSLGGSVELEFDFVSIDLAVWGESGWALCDPFDLSPTYCGAYYWRSGHAMSLKEALVGVSPWLANDASSNWCEEAGPGSALGAGGNFGSPGLVSQTTGECG